MIHCSPSTMLSRKITVGLNGHKITSRGLVEHSLTVTWYMLVVVELVKINPKLRIFKTFLDS